jgi:hypothetical protein
MLMVVVALRGPNIPVLPVPQHNSVFFLQVKASARKAQENLITAPLTQNIFPTAAQAMQQWRPTWIINETE